LIGGICFAFESWVFVLALFWPCFGCVLGSLKACVLWASFLSEGLASFGVCQNRQDVIGRFPQGILPAWSQVAYRGFLPCDGSNLGFKKNSLGFCESSWNVALSRVPRKKIFDPGSSIVLWLDSVAHHPITAMR
jgi:hypothetical protein